jgi:ADP-heptose:LPS heptosyltransferase
LNKKKILIIRFSSIGDIVLASPVVRCLKQQLPNIELHFVSKKKFSDVLENNQHIDKLHFFKDHISELYGALKAEKFDLVIDLHNNLRSTILKLVLRKPSATFNKINFNKFLAVRFKMIKALPRIHIVERYFEPLKKTSVLNDNKGLEYFLSAADEVNCAEEFFKRIDTRFIALIIGGSYFTKQIPLNKLQEICANATLPIILLGGKNDSEKANKLSKQFKVIDTCGKISLNQSASIIKQSEWVITSDTGLMHIAAAFNKKIISVWGNTIPQFGMGPFLPQPENKILEVRNLSCRPCSKLGFHKCMNNQNFRFISELK